ncbi:MAG: serine hydroxymethyltransferase [Patescibacteria group bacterium]|nr:serine hydroxymethyltransferase [Patescibacteria group bacterium]MCL5224339.1 serine hydroxymethyltransferase [Patescibacteria group bacterium]
MKEDGEIRHLTELETRRQEDTIDLIASENIASPAVRKALASVFVNKYSEGYPGRRYYPGNVYVDKLEKLTQDRAIKLFRLNPKNWHVNVQPYSGSPANLAVYTALLNPGDTLLGLGLSSGGHLTHGHSVSASGMFWKAEHYTIDPKTERINYDALEKIAVEKKPKIIISGFTAYPRKIDFKRIGVIAKRIGAYHLADISHIAGLVATGEHPSPFPYADVVMTTTHKTLRGPRGAVLFCRYNLGDKIDQAVFPGLQGGPHDNAIAAKAVAFFEDSQPEFKKYIKQVVSNAKALATALQADGLRLVSGGTDTHLILADVTGLGLDGLTAEKRLEGLGIIANRNTIPKDKSAFRPSGLRIGTPTVTARGMREKDMAILAGLVVNGLRGVKGVDKEVSKLCRKFPVKRLLRS